MMFSDEIFLCSSPQSTLLLEARITINVDSFFAYQRPKISYICFMIACFWMLWHCKSLSGIVDYSIYLLYFQEQKQLLHHYYGLFSFFYISLKLRKKFKQRSMKLLDRIEKLLWMIGYVITYLKVGQFF